MIVLILSLITLFTLTCTYVKNYHPKFDVFTYKNLAFWKQSKFLHMLQSVQLILYDADCMDRLSSTYKHWLAKRVLGISSYFTRAAKCHSFTCFFSLSDVKLIETTKRSNTAAFKGKTKKI